jgi:hypothetical protein
LTRGPPAQNPRKLLRNYKIILAQSKSVLNQGEISAGVPQGSTLEPILYLLHSANIPLNPKAKIAMFANDTAILSISDSYDQAVTNLQAATSQVCLWAKLNKEKSCRVDFSRWPCNYIPTTMNDKFIPRTNSAKYLGMHLDRRLKWKVHIKQKRDELNVKLRKLYRLIGYGSTLSLANKRLIYQSILKPVWTNGLQIGGVTKQSNRLVIQRFQNKVLQLIAEAPWFVLNMVLYCNLKIQSVNEIISLFAANHESRLHHNHPNVAAIQLLDTTNDIRRLKSLKPLDLI